MVQSINSNSIASLLLNYLSQNSTNSVNSDSSSSNSLFSTNSFSGNSDLTSSYLGLNSTSGLESSQSSVLSILLSLLGLNSQNNTSVVKASATSDTTKTATPENEVVVHTSISANGTKRETLANNRGFNKYDKNGKLTTTKRDKLVTEYNESGTVKRTLDRTNKTNGVLIKKYDENNNISDITDSVYDKGGNLTAKTYDVNGNLIKTISYERNADGRLIASRVSENGVITVTGFRPKDGKVMNKTIKEDETTKVKEGASDPIEKLYLDLLGRSSDADGKKYWQGRLAEGMSISEIESSIKDSDEYKAKA